jgi:hypothetical protein
MASAGAIRRAIRESDLDREEIRDIYETLRQKSREVDRKATANTKVGDRIRIISGRPRYLIGTEGTIVAKRQTKFEALMDEAVGRFGRQLVLPPGMFTVIKSADEALEEILSEGGERS